MTTQMSRHIDVSVIVPCRNESRHIGELINRVLQQKGAGTEYTFELILVDGKSDDDTLRKIATAAKDHPEIRIIHNNKQITPVAFNLGINAAKGEYICILGAHSRIAADYILAALNAIRSTKTQNVGGPWHAIGEGFIGSAIALAFQSPMSSGGALSHSLEYEGCVDSVWGGFYPRTVFEKIGLFDEYLVRNQDDELNFRLILSGGTIYQTPKIKYEYVCRDTLRKLWTQYYQYGFYKVYILKKHKRLASIRHAVPAIFLLSIICLAILGLTDPWFFYGVYACIGLYLFVLIVGAIHICSTSGRWRYFMVLPVVLASFHLPYGLGFIFGLKQIFGGQDIPQGS